MKLYSVVTDRKANFEEGSYTCYLFSKGEDKICKKCGEECAEMIIAAKNNNKEELKNEVADLLYHITVLCAEKGLDFCDVEAELAARSEKIGNLKQMKVTDRNT
ncbi:MAG: phosphoribosyl-ATP diphosphatase [Ruminococcus sp.]|jgi:phosphoribosyl-ATP pyrophosphohydrolase|nr:phosphoribosyl-ATP diphosphatase [Ruminococcus sp.]